MSTKKTATTTATTATKSRKPRTVDPAIAELRAQFKIAAEKLKSERKSAPTLEKIMKLVPKLTDGDKAKLALSLDTAIAAAGN